MYQISYNTLGEYSTKLVNQYLEIISEALTKFITNSLNGVKLVKNPADEFKKTSKEFKLIMRKVILFA